MFCYYVIGRAVQSPQVLFYYYYYHSRGAEPPRGLIVYAARGAEPPRGYYYDYYLFIYLFAQRSEAGRPEASREEVFHEGAALGAC